MGKSSAASSETADTPSPDTAYSANEKVLCHHKNQLYEAKILQVKIEDGAPKYEVHYQGWNNRWDEWVDEDRLMKFSEEKLKEMSSKTPAGKAGGGSQRGRSSQGGGEPSSRSRTPATGGKTKTATGSSGPSTPFDGSTKSGGKAGIGDGIGGLDLESRASTPSNDGGASVASSSTTGQVSQSASVKRKAGGKPKSGAGSVTGTPSTETAPTPTNDDTPSTGESKRKRGRNNPPIRRPTTPSATMQPPAASATPAPNDTVHPSIGVESFEQFRGRPEVQIKIPDELKELIADDWDLVTRQSKLYNLPAAKSVDNILDEYAKTKGQRVKQPQVQELVSGIREYFNEMCGLRLLYKFERPQYNDILSKSQQDENNAAAATAEDGTNGNNRIKMSSWYGFPHLLRLFVRMGQMLAYTDLDQKSTEAITGWIQDLLKFLAKNRLTYFKLDDYTTAPPEYVRTAYSGNQT